MLQMRERHPTTQHLCDQLTDLEIDYVCLSRLFDMIHLPVIQTNSEILIVLVER